ncbi:hypothetical protein [Cerasicoccus maritimus]|uniref:hypothetical protein n=1 Tax=Cerasicoccus maritimus TaxID=490089 RepID=UPI002852A2F8|nr:hypothetical protein [Cerasicoccus maritimus]
MRLCFAISFLLWAASTHAVGQWMSILPDYVVVGITRIGEAPADVVVESAAGDSVHRRVGDCVGEFVIANFVRVEGEWFVEVRREGIGYLFACKRPQEAPFAAGPLANAYSAGLIGRDGKLTHDGRNAIAEHLLAIANAGHEYVAYTGAEKVDFVDMAKQGYLSPDLLQPVAGEDYSQIVVSSRGGALMVRTGFGEVVRWAY